MSDTYEKRFVKYFFEDGRILNSEDYTIDTFGVVRYTTPYIGQESPSVHWVNGYARVNITYNKKQEQLGIARIVASTFLGPPPALTYTADHKYRDRNDDRLENIQWLDKSGQVRNRDMPVTQKTAPLIVNGDKKMTANEWASVFRKNNGELYSAKRIKEFARDNKHGFHFEEYPNLEGEEWKPVAESENSKGRWEVSNMCRMKYITKHIKNVISDDRIGLQGGYPTVGINGINIGCHIITFKTWFPEEYKAMNHGEMILHKNDNRMDFRPENLYIGTHPQNTKDAHDNGKYNGKKTGRQKCASYIDGIFEKEHDSQSDAARYLQTCGWPKASYTKISAVLSGDREIAYNRTWKLV